MLKSFKDLLKQNAIEGREAQVDNVILAVTEATTESIPQMGLQIVVLLSLIHI